MDKYEYLVLWHYTDIDNAIPMDGIEEGFYEHFTDTDKQVSLVEALNFYGAKGWRVATSANVSGVVKYVLERKK